MNKTEKKTQINRRDFLKVLGATGVGLTAGLMLPGKWIKPASRMGVLPAHAQSSQIRYNIVDSAEEFFWNQQEDYFGSFKVYIDPPASGIAMKASYTVDYGNMNIVATPPPAVELTPVNTVDGEAIFADEPLSFDWQTIEITYELVDPAVCDVTCTRTVTLNNTPQ